MSDLFKNFDAESYLAKRLKDHGMGIFTGATDPAMRKERFRQAIIAGNLDCIIVSKKLSKSETYAQYFERLYGEALVKALPKLKTKRKIDV